MKPKCRHRQIELDHFNVIYESHMTDNARHGSKPGRNTKTRQTKPKGYRQAKKAKILKPKNTEVRNSGKAKCKEQTGRNAGMTAHMEHAHRVKITMN